MSEALPSSGSSKSRKPTETIGDRVLARVHDVSQSLGHRTTLRGRSRSKDLESRSLVRVFKDLGNSYRAYRRSTGQPVSTDIRTAAERFRKERSVTNLVSVAASLDRLEILSW